MAKTNLVLISGGGNSHGITERIANVLRNDLRLGGRVEVIKSIVSGEEKRMNIPRGAKCPLVVDRYNNTEMRVDSGKAQIYDLRDAYIAVVKHLYDPESGLSVNDALMQARYLFDWMNRGEIDALRKVLVVPYLPFVGAHSIEKYRKMGFIEADRLGIFVRDLKSVDVQDLFSIHPHSMDILDHCDREDLVSHMKDSFTGVKYTDYCKLGFRTREEAEGFLKKMHTFTTHLEQTAAENPDKKWVGVVADDGAEIIMKMIVTGTNMLDYCDLLYLNKERRGEGQSRITGVKRFSGVSLDQLKGRRCIILDDVLRSGTTLNDTGAFLKENGAEYVEGWVTHAECPGVSEVHLNNLDKIVALRTLPHEVKGVTYIHGAAYILAASVYRNYCHELEKRGESLSFMNRN